MKKDLTIEMEPCEYTGNEHWLVFEHGTYEESSVLAGQHRRSCIGDYDTLAEATAEHPEAQVLDHSTHMGPLVSPPMSDVEPEWFDPTIAGESWGEDY